METFDVLAFLALQYASVFSVFPIVALFDRAKKKMQETGAPSQNEPPLARTSKNCNPMADGDRIFIA